MRTTLAEVTAAGDPLVGHDAKSVSQRSRNKKTVAFRKYLPFRLNNNAAELSIVLKRHTVIEHPPSNHLLVSVCLSVCPVPVSYTHLTLPTILRV